MNEATLLPVTIIFYTGGGGEEGVGEEGVREENGWKKRNKGSQFSKHGRGREGRQREGSRAEGGKERGGCDQLLPFGGKKCHNPRITAFSCHDCGALQDNALWNGHKSVEHMV